MNAFLHRHHRLLFYGTWLLLGILQSGLTELQDDEAYYWVYSRFLDWGYFDHPPLTALLVKMGYTLFPNELGVRLFPLLLNLGSLFIIEKLLRPDDRARNPFLFYAIALSLAVIQLSGFLAVPDIPLIFFTALFFLAWRRLNEKPGLTAALLVGFAAALLLYSKYHAVLIIFFALLSRLSLLRRYHIYLAGGVALLLYLPHLWWQYEHNWVSFRYHLFESNVNAYKFSYTTDFLAGQLLLAGPLAGILLLPAALRVRTEGWTERALKVTTVGIYVFFLLSSLRGKVEGNWTSPALVGLIVLAHAGLAGLPHWRTWLWRLTGVTLILVMAGRIIMIEDLVPSKAVRLRYHAWKNWPAEMKEKTKGLPVVFSNSYQRASKYWFYSGQPTYSLNHYHERRNNYNFWPLEDSLLSRPVYFLDIYDLWRFRDSLKTPLGQVGYRYDSAFAGFAKIQVTVTTPSQTIRRDQEMTLRCRFDIPPLYRDYLLKNGSASDTVRIGFFEKGKWKRDLFTLLDLQALAREPETEISIQPGLPPGNYEYRFAINHAGYFPTHNSEKYRLKIE